MTVIESVFFDTSPFIYLIENHPDFCKRVSDFFLDQSTKENLFLSSVLTVAEFEVKPKRTNNQKSIDDFKKVLREFNFRILEINYEIAELSSTLRSKYHFLKPIDALQLSSAITLSCKSFLTNDFQLKKVTEIEIILVESL